ncbi:AAA family ATPase [Gimesia sp.]|uniref:AAA family ATPase n=1 Tax=Gimesia sp. TaxID=2024833 RepID=UPI000C3C8D19|nr:AAA family ATPase [Gimesia sp.]MAX38367.1 ATPase [Gimesia sp.]|tara:strand:+ start:5443 stop:6930 length:1488 start_codon:yes stop_codon:yes gene_type:complete
MPNSLELLIRSGNPLISIETLDEQRALKVIQEIAINLKKPIFEWSTTAGLCRLENGSLKSATVPGGKPEQSLTFIRQNTDQDLFVFKDLGAYCRDSVVNRMLRDLMDTCHEKKSTIILIDAFPLPDEIKRFTIRYELGWPTAEELSDVIKLTYNKIKRESDSEIKARLTRREMEQLVLTMRGLSCSEVERVISSAILQDNDLNANDLPHVIEAKRTLLGSTGCLESIAVDVKSEEVGGLNKLKDWLKLRRGGFTQKAQDYGIEPPRGVLMLGVPGSGKSLCAKMVASDWNMALLRLDPGMLYQKFIGESESQLRQALSQAESMAPVILWIDEIEKAFASASGSSADGGLSKRMFGTLLAWMQDHRHPIFIIATANDISALPPELMRKGRFDEVFFVDLPTPAAREQILKIHLQRRKRDSDQFDLRSLAALAEDFTGSELEQAVMSGLFAAFAENAEIEDRHIASEIQKTRPLAVLMKERISELRLWAQNRCVPAD